MHLSQHLIFSFILGLEKPEYFQPAIQLEIYCLLFKPPVIFEEQTGLHTLPYHTDKLLHCLYRTNLGCPAH